jgi:hypothetical protein
VSRSLISAASVLTPGTWESKHHLMNYQKNQRMHSKSGFQSHGEQVEQQELYPVRKAEVADKGNVYFIPVSRFPIPVAERKSIKRFLDELQKRYAGLAETELLGCLGIISNVLEFEVLEKIGLNVFDWQPQLAMAVFPDQPPPHVPSREEALSWKEGFPVHEVMPMISYITRKNALGEAYAELFGCGGTIFYTTALEERKLFAKTKEVFGYKITDKSFQMMDCLPVLGIDTLLKATSSQFRALYSVAGLYIGESMRDEGLIIISDRWLDKEISELAHILLDKRKR